MSKSVPGPPIYSGYALLDITADQILSPTEFTWREDDGLRSGAEIMAEARSTADAATVMVGIILESLYFIGLIIWLLR